MDVPGAYMFRSTRMSCEQLMIQYCMKLINYLSYPCCAKQQYYCWMSSKQIAVNVEQQRYISILYKYKLNSLSELNQMLFESDLYEKHTYDQKIKIKKDMTYPQIIEEFGHKEANVKEAKAILREKYKNDDILRAHQARKLIWMIFSKAKFRISDNKNYYQTLKNTEYSEFYRKIIDADVRRTLQQKCQQTHNQLSNILRCLSKRNPFMGYCQGMNFIINFLITMQFEEEECFWLAVDLFEQIVPKNYYTNMQGVAIDIKIIEQFLKIKRSDIVQKLSYLNISISILALEWLVCLCTTILPYYLLVIVWDLLFIEGSSVLLKTVIILIQQMQELISISEDQTDFLSKLEFYKKKIHIQESTFLERLKKLSIDPVYLKIARQVYFQLLKSDEPPSDSKKYMQIPCNPKWPICHQQLQKNRIQQIDPQIWVFKEEGPPRMIENYLEAKIKGVKIFKEDDRSQVKKLKIGRVPHICLPEAYQIFQGKRCSIELNQYDSANNSYEIAGDQMKQRVSYEFMQNAKYLNNTFIFKSTNDSKK